MRAMLGSGRVKSECELFQPSGEEVQVLRCASATAITHQCAAPGQKEVLGLAKPDFQEVALERGGDGNYLRLGQESTVSS